MSAVRRTLLAVLALSLTTGLLAVPVAPAVAAPSEPLPASGGGQPILLLVDTSGSMGDQDANGTEKLEGAKTGLLRLLNEMPLETEIGLHTYPAADGACDTGTEIFPVERREPDEMSAKIRALGANGDTPTAEALRAAGSGLVADGFENATVVVVSDGESTCADPCPVARDLLRDGLQVTIHTVGFAIDAASGAEEELRCLADATGGTYTRVSDTGGLGERLYELSAPSVTVQLDTAETFNPEAQSALTVRATVTNPTERLVTDVRADLRFDAGGSAGAPAVTAPLQLLGNLEPGGSRSVSWTVHTTRTRAEGELVYVVRAISPGAEMVEVPGQITMVGGLDINQGGELFRDADHVVVLGDSYSSGEGAREYEKSTGAGSPGCHRSRHQYAVQLFGAERVTNLACSGAVIDNHVVGQTDRSENGSPLHSQERQLSRLDAVDLVLLTMGGNDMGFSDIIKSCLLPGGCDGVVLCHPDQPEIVGDCDVDLDNAWERELGNLQVRLAAYYRDVLADTGHAPVIVLPYVNVVPLSDRGSYKCADGLPGIFREELQDVRWLQAQLNRKIAAAVETVRSEGHEDRLYLASDVETALQPDHTICDEKPWLVPVLPHAATYAQQELVHPNAEGNRAIGAALLRWSARVDPPTVEDSAPTVVGSSLSDQLIDVLEGAAQGVQTAIGGTPVLDLGTLQPAAPVQAGQPVTLQGSGYADGASVVIGIRSSLHTLTLATADEDGSFSVTVDVPEGYEGEHALYAMGFTEDGDYLVLAQPVEVGAPPVWGALILSLLAALLAVAGWLVVRLGLRRRRRPAPVTGPVGAVDGSGPQE